MVFNPQELQPNKNLPPPSPVTGFRPPVEPTRQQLRQQEAQRIEKTKEVLEEERIYRRGVVSVRDLIAPASLEVNSSYLKLGELFVRTIFVFLSSLHCSWLVCADN